MLLPFCHRCPNNDIELHGCLTRQESDQYGKGIGYSDSALSATVRNTESKGEIARKKGEGLYPMAPPAPAAEPAEPVTKLNRPLPNYQTNTKQEHPMYATTNNQFGFKNPDRSTMTVDRVFIPQEFSNSFNNIKVRWVFARFTTHLCPPPPLQSHCGTPLIQPPTRTCSTAIRD